MGAFDEFDDPEQSYRRGYAHGAWDVLSAVKELLPKAERDKLDAWYAQHVWEWRLKSMRGESRRIDDRPNPFPPGVRPPREHLKLASRAN